MAWHYYQGIRDRGVSVNPDGSGDTHVVHMVFPDAEPPLYRGTKDWDSWVYRAECDAIISLAGPIAEWRYLGRAISGALRYGDHVGPANADLNVVDRLLKGITRKKENLFYQQLLQEQTKRILRDPRARAAVEEIARALIARRHVSEKTVEAICGKYKVPRAKRLHAGGVRVFVRPWRGKPTK